MNQETAPKIHSGTILLLMLLISIIGSFASDSYLPSFPAIVKDFSATNTLVKLTVSAYLLSYSLSQLAYGPLSDRFGRRRVLLLGNTIFIAASLICALAPNIFWLIGGRFLQGLGVGASTVLYRAILRDCYSGHALAKLSAYASTLATIVMPVAPIIGGYLQQSWGWRSNFILMLIYTLLTTLALWRWMPETNRQPDPTATQLSSLGRNFLALIRNRSFVSYLSYSTLAFSGIIVYLVISPFLFQNLLGLTPVQYGWLAIFIAPCSGLGAFTSTRHIEKFDIAGIVKIGSYIMLIGASSMLVLAWLGYFNIWVILIPIMIYAFGCGFVFANAFAGAFEAFSHIAGSAAAVYGCLQILGSSLTSIIAAYVHETNQVPLAVILLLITLAIFIIMYLYPLYLKMREFNV